MYADPGRLRQVLINLLSNAVKFGIPGPVMLLARGERDAHGRNRLLLAVRDRGPVIEEAGRARLFRPFSRLDLTGGEPLGSGLGLAICRYLVTLMGGEIGCRTWVSEDGHAGNEFWVRLPQAPLPAGARPRSATPDAPPRLVLPRTRILLVEDIAANQLITALLLRREGHMVDVAGTGEAALRAVGRLPYDLVFTDLHLPGIDGFELARQIRALPGAAGAVPIVALTANTGPDDRLDCERAGIGDLLDKPVALADLVAALGRHVWRGRPGRAGHAAARRTVPGGARAGRGPDSRTARASPARRAAQHGAGVPGGSAGPPARFARRPAGRRRRGGRRPRACDGRHGRGLRHGGAGDAAAGADDGGARAAPGGHRGRCWNSSKPIWRTPPGRCGRRCRSSWCSVPDAPTVMVGAGPYAPTLARRSAGTAHVMVGEGRPSTTAAVAPRSRGSSATADAMTTYAVTAPLARNPTPMRPPLLRAPAHSENLNPSAR